MSLRNMQICWSTPSGSAVRRQVKAAVARKRRAADKKAVRGEEVPPRFTKGWAD